MKTQVERCRKPDYHPWRDTDGVHGWTQYRRCATCGFMEVRYSEKPYPGPYNMAYWTRTKEPMWTLGQVTIRVMWVAWIACWNGE